jgi:pimeloyl-ACP methyl ester carboxylesterase
LNIDRSGARRKPRDVSRDAWLAGRTRRGVQTMATYDLVHGAGHGGWCWGRTAPRLRAAGHEVLTPTLTGVGERAHLLTPDIDLETHIADVLGVLAWEDLSDVILVGHSYGGMVVTGVADRAPERIAQLVYLDAIIPGDGDAAADMFPRFVFDEVRVVDGVELGLWPEPARYGLVDPADVAWAAPRLSPHPWRTLTQPLRLHDAAAVRRIPRTIVNCAGRLDHTEGAWRERLLDGERVWEIDTGHDLMISAPEAVAGMLLKLTAI